MDSLEKYWKELIAIIVGGGFFTFLGTILNQIANKNKTRSEETKNNSEADKLEAEADLARGRFMVETQKALADMAKDLQAMREKYDLMYDARENRETPEKQNARLSEMIRKELWMR